MANRKDLTYGNSRMEWVIAEYVHSERDRQLLRRRFLDGITQDAVANELQMSKRQIQYIESWFIRVIVSLHKDKLI